MFPRTRAIPLLTDALVGLGACGALVGLGACGAPPQPLPTVPPYSPTPSVSAWGPPPSISVTLPGATPPLMPGPAGYPAYPTYAPLNPGATTRPTTASPTPTPSHAARCAGEPTGPQILALIKGKPGIPDKKLKVHDGPFCSGDWSFTTVEIAGKTEDQLEPLMVMAFGKGAGLNLLIAGTDACTDMVVDQAPPGIRVLACGS